MAKMFYSLEETAEKLGKSEDEIKQMAASGDLQQFRDRDKVMFKRDQVDAMASGGDTSGDSAELNLEDPSIGDTDAIDLQSATSEDHDKSKKDRREATGISVFDADEVKPADSAAQTVVSGAMGDDEDLALESVGSGSGLLDLTRESDDTSLGAELLEEIYPGGESKNEGSAIDNIFESAGGAESAPSALADIEGPAPSATAAPTVTVEASDPVGSGWTGGLLIGALAALIIASIVLATGLAGTTAQLTEMFAGNLMVWAGGLAALTIVLAVIGLVVGKAASR